MARELNIATATAEVYGIDCLVAGGELDHEMMAGYLKVNKTSFDIMKQEILSSGDKKLRTVQDNLGEVYTYNQLRFVLACMIHELVNFFPTKRHIPSDSIRMYFIAVFFFSFRLVDVNTGKYN